MLNRSRAVKCNKRLVGNVSTMATFEGKVVQERCPHTISYAKSRSTYEGARRSKVRPRMPRKPPKPPPRLKKQNRRRTVDKDAVNEKRGVNEKTFQLSDTTVIEEAATVLPKYTTNFETAKSKSKPTKVAKSKLSWEEHVIGQLSAESADHVIKEVTSSIQAERLRRFLVQCRASPDTRGGDDGDNDDVILNDIEVDDDGDDKFESPAKCGRKPSSSDSLSKYPDKGVTLNQEQDVYPRKPCDWVTISDNEKELVKGKGDKSILPQSFLSGAPD